VKKARDTRYKYVVRTGPPKRLPDWLSALITPIVLGLFLGVLALVVPVGLVLRWVLG
jgi:hypothetical protein